LPFITYKLITIFLLTSLFISLLIRYAPKLGLVDIPNHRSIHKKITPRGAGIGMIFAIILADLLFYTSETFSHIWSLFGVFLVFVIGFLDDHRDSSPKTKFITIFIAVLFFYQDGIVIDSLGTIFGINLPLGWLAIPFTMFAVAGFTNALNLSDGLDGLAGSLSFVVLSVLCYIGFQNNDGFIVSLSASFMAAIAAFLIFNWNPAKIFMGDSGSLTLGAVIALLSIKALDYIQPTAILFLAALPIKDTIIVMIRRKLNGSSIFCADKTHIHHVMLKFFNGNIKKTVVLLALLQLFYSLIALSFIENDYKQRYILTLFILSLTISYILLDTMLNCQNNPLNCHRKKLKKNK
jgi:UDP-GlcNAc:undecaprenyl-phosphate GlcNAc-1-phosphate transferase